jgi:hypothetical protein
MVTKVTMVDYLWFIYELSIVYLWIILWFTETWCLIMVNGTGITMC